MAVRSLKYNPEHKVLVSGSDDLHINLIDYSTCKVIQALVGHKESITKIEYNQYLNLYASSSLDGTIKLWDFRNKESRCVQTINICGEQNNMIWDIAFSSMGDYLVASTENNILLVLNKS